MNSFPAIGPSLILHAGNDGGGLFLHTVSALPTSKCIMHAVWQVLQDSSAFHGCTAHLRSRRDISTTCYWNLRYYPLQEPDICTEVRGLFDPVHTEPPSASNSPETERSRCSSIRQRWGAMSSSNIERGRRRERWGYENDWWEHKWQSCDWEERGGRGWR